MDLSPIHLLRNPFAVLLGTTVISVLALSAAFISEGFLGLEPCILCIYQRWPYAAVILFGLIGLKKSPAVQRAMIGLSGVTFLINSAIALYHSGVEQHWWRSAVEGCLIPGFGSDEPQNLLDNILSAPSGRCDEIPWQDPLIGLSMANYNAILCFGLFLICMASVALLRNTKNV